MNADFTRPEADPPGTLLRNSSNRYYSWFDSEVRSPCFFLQNLESYTLLVNQYTPTPNSKDPNTPSLTKP